MDPQHSKGQLPHHQPGGGVILLKASIFWPGAPFEGVPSMSVDEVVWASETPGGAQSDYNSQWLFFWKKEVVATTSR